MLFSKRNTTAAVRVVRTSSLPIASYVNLIRKRHRKPQRGNIFCWLFKRHAKILPACFFTSINWAVVAAVVAALYRHCMHAYGSIDGILVWQLRSQLLCCCSCQIDALRNEKYICLFGSEFYTRSSYLYCCVKRKGNHWNQLLYFPIDCISAIAGLAELSS